MKKMFGLMASILSCVYSFSQSDATFRDITATRGDGTGAYFFGSSTSNRYFYWNGTDYILGGGLGVNHNVLHSGNFNSYTPTLTGVGASGNWNISAAAWGGNTLVGEASSTAPNYLFGAYPGGNANYSDATAVKLFLGIPSTGETLQSVTDRGNTTSQTITVANLYAYSEGNSSAVVIGSSAIGKTGIAISTSADVNGYGVIQTVKASGTQYGDIILNPSAGNVGIGTSSPSSRLAVNGDISLSNRLTFADGTLYSDINNMASFHNGGFIWSSADNSTTKMELSSNGDLFVSGNQVIGRNWAQKNLDVNGIVKTRKVKVTLTDWADYVFDSSYQLASLYQVEKFIQANKHLPEVPSAAEVKKEGLDLGDNQAVLLRKIEELTLYIIEQNKHVESQKQQLETQNKQLEAQKQNNATLENRLSAIEKMLAELKR